MADDDAEASLDDRAGEPVVGAGESACFGCYPRPTPQTYSSHVDRAWDLLARPTDDLHEDWATVLSVPLPYHDV